MPPLTGQLRAGDLRPIRQHHNFRRRKVPDFHECRAVSVLHRNLLSNRMRAGVSASDSSLRGVRDHGQERCHPAKRISGSGWRVQVRIHHHIAAPRFVAMAVYNAQSLLVIQNSRPCDKLTGRRQGERETKIRHRSLILPPVAQHGEALPHLNECGDPDVSRRGGIKAVSSGGAKGAEPIFTRGMSTAVTPIFRRGVANLSPSELAPSSRIQGQSQGAWR